MQRISLFFVTEIKDITVTNFLYMSPLKHHIKAGQLNREVSLESQLREG